MIFETNLRPGTADVSDLQRDTLVQWQHNWYFPILAVFGYILPTTLAGVLWGDWIGGICFVGALRMTACHHVRCSVYFRSPSLIILRVVYILHQFRRPLARRHAL